MKKAFPLLLLLSLALAIFAAPAGAQDGEYFWEDFGTGAGSWELDPAWTIAELDGAALLQGEGTGWAVLPREMPGEFFLEARMRILSGSLHLVTHLNDQGRYFISLTEGEAALHKQYWPETFLHDLAYAPAAISEGDWFLVTVTSSGNELQLQVNGEETWTFQDPEKLAFGAVALEVPGDSLVQVDFLALDLPQGWLEGPPAEEGTGPGTADSGQDPGEGSGAPEAELLETPPAWIRTGGPLGGLGYDVRMHPNNPDKMYVTDSFAGVFISENGGKTWYPSNTGITDRAGESQDSIPVFCLTIDPHNPDLIWAGTQFRGGLFRSTDGGQSWTRKTNGITIQEGLTFRGITIDPVDPQTIYAGGEISSWVWAGEPRDGREFDLTKGILYKSTDGGESWTEIWRGDNMARYIWVNPEDNQILYVSTGIFDREAANSDPENAVPGGVGVIKSTDGGKTWSLANNGLENLYVGSLFMHPEDPDILLAGTGNNQYFHHNGIYLSTDGAESWTEVYGDININSVEFSTSDPTIAYAGGDPGILRSEDSGRTWTFITRGENGWGAPGVRAGFPIDFQVDPRDPERIFANNYGGGNFLSADGGRSWRDASTGYTGAQVRSLFIDPEQSSLVYAAARSGIFRTLDGGSTWSGIADENHYALEWNAVAVDPNDPNSILAGTNHWQILVHSADRGKSWQSVLELGPNLGVRDLAFSPTDPNLVYAATAGFYSAGGFDSMIPGDGIYRSLDGGLTWEQATTNQFSGAHVLKLAIARDDRGVVYAATSNQGMIRSRDKGESWELINQGFGLNPQVASTAVHPEDPQVVFAGLFSGGIYRSQDGGDSWQMLSPGLNPESYISSIAIDPAHPEVIYIADLFSGVYRSLDSGENWHSFNEGLLMRSVYQLAISGNGAHLYAATDGGGVYRRDLTGFAPDPAAVSLDTGDVEEGQEEDSAQTAEGTEEEQETPTEVSPPEEESKPGSQLCPTSYLPFLAGIGLYLGKSRRGRRKL